MITLDKDVKRVQKLIEASNVEELKKLCLLWMPLYRAQIYTKLDPISRTKWDELLT